MLNFRECLSGAIEHSDAPAVTCPYKDDKYSCDMKLLEREIKAVSTLSNNWFLLLHKFIKSGLYLLIANQSIKQNNF